MIEGVRKLLSAEDCVVRPGLLTGAGRHRLQLLPTHLREQRFILVHDAIPIVVTLHPDLRPVAITLDQRPVS